MPELTVETFLQGKKRIARIRTSDRSVFKRCRRKWHWSSGLRLNLESNRIAEPFWLGKGVHYALEDFHGHNVYGTPDKAFEAFMHAWKQVSSRTRHPQELPDNVEENYELGIGMLKHYSSWLTHRDPLKTFWFNGHPQVEVMFEIPLPIDCRQIPDCPFDEVVYGGTLDRVVIDDYGRLWIVEYKTAKQIVTGHFDVDGQISAYCWAASTLYDMEIAGVIYQQHMKTLPHMPKLLANGTYSANKDQHTTWNYYYYALKNLYGDVNRAPQANILMLNHLADLETENRDKFIQRDRVERNIHQMQAEGDKILMEAEDMLDPNLPLYPNPTRDCSWDCTTFSGACIMLDSGLDWENELKAGTQSRIEYSEDWRTYLPDPQAMLAEKLEQESFHE